MKPIIDPKSMSKEMLEKAMACETPEQIMTVAKELKVDITPEEAKSVLAQLENIDINLSDEEMKNVAGGKTCTHCWDIRD